MNWGQGGGLGYDAQKLQTIAFSSPRNVPVWMLGDVLISKFTYKLGGVAVFRPRTCLSIYPRLCAT